MPKQAQVLDYAGRTNIDPRRAIKWLAVIVFIAVVGRLGFALTRSDTAWSLARLPDQVEYLTAGQSILDGKGVSFVDPTFSQTLYAFRMPGYPLLVAACGADVRKIRTVQALFDGSCVIAVFLIGRRLRGDTVGLIAASAVAANPYLIYFSSLVLSETLFTALVTWAVWLLLLPGVRLRTAGVLLLLLTVYIRPSAIGLGVMAAAAITGRTLWRPPLAVCVASAAVLLLLLPWALRNQSIFGRPIWTTTNGGYTAYDSFNPAADGSSNQSGFRPRVETASVENTHALESGRPKDMPLFEFNRQRDMGELARHDEFKRLAWEYARAHPGHVVRLALAKLGRFWSPVPLSADFGGRSIYLLVGGAYAVALFVLAAVGVWRGGLGKRETLILLLPAVYFSLVHCVFVGSLRYRVPCDVPIAVLMAAGAMSFRKPPAAVLNAEAT